jgi:ATP-binding protein involved in chromosome partitioning
LALKRVPIPTDIEIEDDGATVAVTWPGGRIDRLGAFDLRAVCPCAQCVDELTGKRTLRLVDVDPDVRVAAVGRVGRYALAIRFTDGHDTGIYTYEALFEGELRRDDPENGG